MIDVRPATPGDRAAINALLRETLGAGDDPRYERFLEWKHHENPFGESYEWVATDDRSIVGYRAFLRWELIVDGVTHRAVRAVDTATAASHQGKGIFRELTTNAVDEMRVDGVSWVFNTPNDASRPGYLKMGWSVAGRIPVGVIPRSPLVLRHVRKARQPADRWSEATSAFEPALAALDRIGSAPPVARGRGWTTNRTPDFLRWRYGLDALNYRAAVADTGAAVIFRVRRRGPLREAFIADVIGDAPAGTQFVRMILKATKADVAVATGRVRPRLAVPVSGPQLTWRALADERVPTMAQLDLTGGDLELF